MCAFKAVPPAESKAPEKQPRPVSGVAYPYFDLDQSIKVAQAIYEQGGGQCTPEQLAAWLNYKSTSSGTYAMRFYATKHFGLIDSSKGVITLTDRARAILAPVMPEDSAKAKVDAFLAIPLFTAIYEKFKGQALPPEMGMKNLLQNTYKVVPERIPQALRVMMNSAEQAGFFSISKDRSRMISPVVTAHFEKPAVPPSEKDEGVPEKPVRFSGGGGGTGGDGPKGIHEAISGLLRYLPPPGTPWSAQKKEAFMKAFTAAIELIYPDEGQP